MNTEEISITYGGEIVTIEANNCSMEISRKQAYHLMGMIKDIDNRYNLRGRVLLDEEWDKLDSMLLRCSELNQGQSIFLEIGDEDMQIAFSKMCEENKMNVMFSSNMAHVTKTPF